MWQATLFQVVAEVEPVGVKGRVQLQRKGRDHLIVPQEEGGTVLAGPCRIVLDFVHRTMTAKNMANVYLIVENNALPKE